MSSQAEASRRVRALVGSVATLAAGSAFAVHATPVHYAPAPETAVPAPGPNVDLVTANCTACHSFDYITTQPRDLSDPAAFWTAEVNKMRTTYGAPIDPASVKPIVDYLVAVYGK